MNVGVIVYCSEEKFLHCMFHLDDQRLLAITTALVSFLIVIFLRMDFWVTVILLMQPGILLK